MMRKSTRVLSHILLSAVMLFSFEKASAVFTPVPILSGFNQDVIANGVGSPTVTTTAAFDNTTNCLVAQNYQLTGTGPVPLYYLPNNGLITSANTSTPGLTWQLASYTGNNSLKLTTLYQIGTLTLGTPNLRGDVYLLGSSGDGATTANITVNFSDLTSQTFTGVSFADWYNGTTVAIQGIGRVARSTGAIDNAGTTTNPRLYQTKLTLSISNYYKNITSITVTKTNSSGALNILGINVDHQTCLPVLNLSATAITTTTATVGWSAVTGTSGYQYAVTTSATPPGSGTPTTATSINLTSLNVGTTYYLHVRNFCGGTSYSIWNTFSFNTLACPSAGSAVISNNVPGSVTITWPGNTASGIVGYQYAVTTSAVAPTSGWTSTTNTTANVTGLIPGTNYYAWVRTDCSNTTAGWLSTLFYNPFPPCLVPSNLIMSNLNMHGVTLKWNNGFNGIGYRYAVSTSNIPPVSGGTVVLDTTVDVINLTAATKYYVHLRTHCGTTNFSSWIIDSFETPATCLGVVATSIDSVTTSKAIVRWNSYPGIAGYEYFINNSVTPPTINGNFTLFNAAAPLNLYSGTKYYFHVRIKCNNTSFSPWKTDSFTTLPVCVQPEAPTVTNLTTNSAKINWGSVSVAQSYETAVTTSITPPLVGAATTNLSYTATQLTPNTGYYFHIRSFCSATDISNWTTVYFTTLPLAIENVDPKYFTIDAYPNPVSNQLHLKVNGTVKGNAQIFLFDISGKMILQSAITENEHSVDMTSLSSGLYILKYVDSETSGTLKIQKN